MIDYLIVGQGLAGSLLAWELARRGRDVLVLDDGHRSAASRVAAGLVNPLAGMRFNAHPRTSSWLASMQRSLTDIAATLGTPCRWHPLPMTRLFRSAEQRRFHQRQLENPAVAQFLGKPFAAGAAVEAGIRAPHGGFCQHHTGYVEIPPLLDELADWLRARDALRIEAVTPSSIEVAHDAVRLQGHRAAHLVFCDGYRLRENPWFDWLPLQPDKGEILRLRSSSALCRTIINGSHWLLPLRQGDYRFGATHEHHRIDDCATEAAREQLQAGLCELLESCDDITITGQLAGVRPATRDRQPFLGTHPQHPRLHLFNGFGARGSLSIPWHARRMADYLLDGRPLPADIDICRHR